jgi:hypothetical protein
MRSLNLEGFQICIACNIYKRGMRNYCGEYDEYYSMGHIRQPNVAFGKVTIAHGNLDLENIYDVYMFSMV